MDPLAVQIFIWIVLSALALSLAGFGVAAYYDSPLHDRRRRLRLQRALSRARFAAVLAWLGVPLGTHVQRSRERDLAGQIRRCRRCRQKAACDDALAAESAAFPIGSCANREVLAVYLWHGGAVPRQPHSRAIPQT